MELCRGNDYYCPIEIWLVPSAELSSSSVEFALSGPI